MTLTSSAPDKFAHQRRIDRSGAIRETPKNPPHRFWLRMVRRSVELSCPPAPQCSTAAVDRLPSEGTLFSMVAFGKRRGAPAVQIPDGILQPGFILFPLHAVHSGRSPPVLTRRNCPAE